MKLSTCIIVLIALMMVAAVQSISKKKCYIKMKVEMKKCINLRNNVKKVPANMTQKFRVLQTCRVIKEIQDCLRETSRQLEICTNSLKRSKHIIAIIMRYEIMKKKFHCL
ncbi:Uncharacterised protein g3838 [Pycnogonum litorale]